MVFPWTTCCTSGGSDKDDKEAEDETQAKDGGGAADLEEPLPSFASHRGPAEGESAELGLAGSPLRRNDGSETPGATPKAGDLSSSSLATSQMSIAMKSSNTSMDGQIGGTQPVSGPIEGSVSGKSLAQESSAGHLPMNTDSDVDRAALFRNYLLQGRLLEAEEMLKVDRSDIDADLIAWLEDVMPDLQRCIGKLDAVGDKVFTDQKSCDWHKVDLDEISTTVLIRRKGDTIQFKNVMELPATLDQAAAINFELDLNGQWLPFSPDLTATRSAMSASLMTHTMAKIPYLPGKREVYTYRIVLDCLGKEGDWSEEDVTGRRGVFFVDWSPDCWKTGGTYKREFVIPAQTKRWVTRDEQRSSIAFWEPMPEGRCKLTLLGEMVINVPRWLLPDSALHFLVKKVATTAYKGLCKCFTESEKYGYGERIRNGKSPLYRSLSARSGDFLRSKSLAVSAQKETATGSR